MNDPLKQRLQALFHEAIGLAADARARFVEEHCADDPVLRRGLQSLLDDEEGATRRLDGSPDLASIVDTLETPDLAGQRVGPYRLLEPLGHGGMGMVYLGERADGEFRQKVAIKLVRGSSVSGQMLARFRTERQILARLEHPNIARLLDGGTTPQGQPYLVMEHVDGEPIDRYCTTHNLTTRQRLRLFLDVCAAVTYAHRQLVIHRDIKPGNILITADGVVKLLDFGIAKLVDDESPQSTTGTPATIVQGAALTPEYASPEQIRGEPATTASDVYSLGVLLYELLTGSPLYRFNSPTLREVEKVVCESPVARPSTAVSRTSRSSQIDHGSRGRLRTDVTPERLMRDLSGDLDTIVVTALNKEPEHRYPSVEQLSDDIQRHLQGYPVKARPPSRAYRLRKFLRRNALASASAAAIVIALVAGAAAAWIGMLEARAQAGLAESRRQDLEQVARFQRSMLTELDPQAMGGGIVGVLRRQYRSALDNAVSADRIDAELAAFENVIARTNATDVARQVIDEFVLTRAVASIESDFSDQPQLQADLYESVRAVYDSIGLYPQQLDISERVVDARQRSGESSTLQLLEARYAHADALYGTGRLADTERALESLMPEIVAAGATARKVRWQARSLLAHVFIEQGRIEEARALAESNLELARELPDTGLDIASLGTLGYIAARSHQGEEALRYYRQAAEAVDEDNPEYMRSQTNFAAALGASGHFEEALVINERLLEIARSRFGQRHTQTFRITNNVAANLMSLNRAEDAVPLLQQQVELNVEVLGEADPLTLRSMLNLGSALARLGRSEEGAPLLENVVRRRMARMGPTHLDTLLAQEVLASILSQAGRHDEAVAMAREAERVGIAAHGAAHPRIVRIQHVVSEALSRSGRHDEAAAMAERMLSAHLDGQPDANPRLRLEWALRLFEALNDLGEHAQAAQVKSEHLQFLLDTSAEALEPWQRPLREHLVDALGTP